MELHTKKAGLSVTRVMKIVLLLVLGGLWEAPLAVRGQVYVAPGMPVQVSGPVAAPVPARRVTASPVKKSAAVPAMPPIESPVFPRFWHEVEPARSQSGRLYYNFQNQHIRYPSTSLRQGVGGFVTVRLSVLPNGRVNKATVVRRAWDEHAEGYDVATPEAAAALEAEVIRVVSQALFKPASIAYDTVTVVQRFSIQ